MDDCFVNLTELMVMMIFGFELAGLLFLAVPGGSN